VVAIACVKLFRSLMSYPELLVNANETVTLTGLPAPGERTVLKPQCSQQRYRVGWLA
jgi:hypothetical protein